MRRTCFGLMCAALLVTETFAATPPAPTPSPAAPASPPSLTSAPSDSEIRRILIDRIDVEKRGVGIVVGVIEPQGRRVVAYGSLEKGDKRPLDGDTIFEIGSITKVFTALLAADMAHRGELKLDDPIAKYLPPGVKVPERNGRQITLVDLATHTSGLPGMPDNFRPKDPANPYVDYTTEALYSFLSSYELPREIGSKFVYSNLGFGLLGQGLAHRAGMDYEQLVITRICEPLHMNSTRITLSPALRQRFAAGHGQDLLTVAAWDIPTLAGAGALRSSTNDLLTFLAAMLGYTDNPLAAAQKTTLETARPTGGAFVDSGLGWVIDTRGGGEIIWKNGGTGGYRTFIGYSPKTRIGIVALANTSTNEGTDDIGLHLLDARFPLSVPDGSPTEHPVDVKTLDTYVGYYEVSAPFILTVTREDNQLFVRGTGQPKSAIYPKSAAEFFSKIVDARFTFETDTQGKVTALVLHQNGRDAHAPRIEATTARQLEDTVAQRFKDQKASPGSEAAIRRQIEELQRREPRFDEFTPELAEIARPQTAHAEEEIASLGALQSAEFKGVGPGGADIYRLKFDQGLVEWRIFLDADGKIATQFWHRVH